MGAARQAMLAEVCPGLGLEPMGAARVVADATEARLVGFLRSQLAARGVAPGQATLIAFGGAGPVQAASVARKLGVPRVVVPYLAAGFSALGCLLSPPAETAMIAVDATLRTLTSERLRELIAAAFSNRTHENLRLALILRRGENPHGDLLPVLAPEESVEARIRRYHAFTERAYGIRPAPETVRIVRLLALREEERSPIALGPSLEATFGRQQRQWSGGPSGRNWQGPSGIPQLALESLEIGSSAEGPALIVLPGASTFVPQGTTYHVDRWGNLILDMAA
jgi:N-methylhydantoinase A